MPPTDYRAAALRWRTDAQKLGPQSLESTDHMVGLSAECACKVLLNWLGATLDATGNLTSTRHRVHLPQVLDELLCLAAGHTAVGVYSRFPYPNPFHDWSIDDRYVPDGQISASSAGQHSKALDGLFAALQTAALDGEFR